MVAAAARIRVLVVDDSPTFRQTMRTLLATYPDIEQVGEASNGNEALECVRRLHPNVVLMDIHLHRVMDGIAATRLILAEHPDVAIIGLSLDKRQYVVSGMQHAGAFEVLTKDEVSAGDLHGAIQRAFASMRDSDWDGRPIRGAGCDGEPASGSFRRLRQVPEADTPRRLAPRISQIDSG